jgi:hypothetical protein
MYQDVQLRALKESPFFPGKPIPVDYFMARESEIREIIRIVNQSASNRSECIFIEGERGIGKSSLAELVARWSSKNLNYLSALCDLSGAKTLEDFSRLIYQRLLEEVDKDLFEKIKGLFGNYIKGIVFYGLNIEFTKEEKDLKNLVLNFAPALKKLYETISEKKNGILLILDNLNGLTSFPEFAPFVKGFFEDITRYSVPFTLILVGLPERRNEMTEHQPSVARIFDLIELKPFNEKESKEFFINNFKRVNVKIETTALDRLTFFSGGIPALMHEVGNAVFLEDKDGKISDHDALGGIVDASFFIGKKYIDNQIIKELQSKTYRNILKKFSEQKVDYNFTRQELLNLFSAKDLEKEKRTIDNFIRRMKKLNMIIQLDIRGQYQFVNHLYHLYLMLHAFRESKKHENIQ